MIRAASLLVFAALAAFLLTADGASPTLLGAKQAGDFLMLEVDGPDGEPRALWQDVLESSAVVEVEDEDGAVRQQLLLGGTLILSESLREGESFDLNWHRVAGSSILRRLRSVAADEGLEIEIPAFKKPLDDGVNFEFTIRDGAGILEANIEFPGSRGGLAQHSIHSRSQNQSNFSTDPRKTQRLEGGPGGPVHFSTVCPHSPQIQPSL